MEGILVKKTKEKSEYPRLCQVSVGIWKFDVFGQDLLIREPNWAFCPNRSDIATKIFYRGIAVSVL